MTNLPNPFSDSGATPSGGPDEAVAPSRSHAPGAAAEFPSSTGGHQEAPASTTTVTVAAGDVGATNDICEIFAGAAKLQSDHDLYGYPWVPEAYSNADQTYYDLLLSMDDPHTADLIDVPYGFEGEFDDPPLFIQEQKRA